MHYLKTRECIDAKSKLFPLETDEYFRLYLEVNSSSCFTKTEAERKSAYKQLQVKIKELKKLYKELETYRYYGDPLSICRYITYQKPAIERTYNMLIARNTPPRTARVMIAHMLRDIYGLLNTISLAYYYYTFNLQDKPSLDDITLNTIIDWPGLIGFPDLKVDASTQPQNT